MSGVTIKTYGKKIGVTLKEAEEKIRDLNKALEDKNMAIGAEMDFHVNLMEKDKGNVNGVTVTVYFFEGNGEKAPHQ